MLSASVQVRETESERERGTLGSSVSPSMFDIMPSEMLFYIMVKKKVSTRTRLNCHSSPFATKVNQFMSRASAGLEPVQ